MRMFYLNKTKGMLLCATRRVAMRETAFLSFSKFLLKFLHVIIL